MADPEDILGEVGRILDNFWSMPHNADKIAIALKYFMSIFRVELPRHPNSPLCLYIIIFHTLFAILHDALFCLAIVKSIFYDTGVFLYVINGHNVKGDRTITMESTPPPPLNEVWRSGDSCNKINSVQHIRFSRRLRSRAFVNLGNYTLRTLYRRERILLFVSRQ